MFLALRMKPEKVCANIWLTFTILTTSIVAQNNGTSDDDAMEIGELKSSICKKPKFQTVLRELDKHLTMYKGR